MFQFELKEYPGLIYDLEIKLLDQLDKKNKAKIDLDNFLIQIDSDIATDVSLKNDTMRKAAKADLLSQSTQYIFLQQDLTAKERQYKLAQLQLEKIKNEFSILKIEANYLIAKASMKLM